MIKEFWADRVNSIDYLLIVSDNNHSSVLVSLLAAAAILAVTSASVALVAPFVAPLALLFLRSRNVFNLELLNDGLAGLVSGDGDREVDVLALVDWVVSFALYDFSINFERLPVQMLLVVLV